MPGGLTSRSFAVPEAGHLLVDMHGYRAGTPLFYVYWGCAHPAAPEEERVRARKALAEGFGLVFEGPACGGLGSVPFDGPRNGTSVAALRKLGLVLAARRYDLLLEWFGLRPVKEGE